MANCELTSGYSIPACNQGTGGLSDIWIGSWSGSTTLVLDVNSVVTGATTAPPMYAFEMDSETATFTENETGVAPGAFGGIFYTQVLNLQFNRNSSSIRNKIMLLSQTKVYAIVKDNNGVYWLLFHEAGGRAASGTGGVGKMMADPNSTSIEFQSNSSVKAYEVSSAALTSFGITV
jgi:hypothetical protein